MARIVIASRRWSRGARRPEGGSVGEHHPALTPEEAHALAGRVAAAMYARDTATQALGIRVERVVPGESQLTMPVREDMLNGHAICHGGFIFTLADSAFAYACNSYNLNTVASGCSIDFVAPARAGDVLTAKAHERELSGRTGVYDVEVANQRGETVALFRGKSYRIKGHLIEE
jgi:acyl-CoA thioesterase